MSWLLNPLPAPREPRPVGWGPPCCPAGCAQGSRRGLPCPPAGPKVRRREQGCGSRGGAGASGPGAGGGRAHVPWQAHCCRGSSGAGSRAGSRAPAAPGSPAPGLPAAPAPPQEPELLILLAPGAASPEPRVRRPGLQHLLPAAPARLRVTGRYLVPGRVPLRGSVPLAHGPRRGHPMASAFVRPGPEGEGSAGGRGVRSSPGTGSRGRSAAAPARGDPWRPPAPGPAGPAVRARAALRGLAGRARAPRAGAYRGSKPRPRAPPGRSLRPAQADGRLGQGREQGALRAPAGGGRTRCGRGAAGPGRQAGEQGAPRTRPSPRRREGAARLGARWRGASGWSTGSAPGAVSLALAEDVPPPGAWRGPRGGACAARGQSRHRRAVAKRSGRVPQPAQVAEQAAPPV